MDLAVRKEQGSILGAGFHYRLHPFKMMDGFHCEVFKRMGYIIISVPEDKGEQLIKSAHAALCHEIEIATLADAAESLG